MPIVFGWLGVLTLVIMIIACCESTATEFSTASVFYFGLVFLLITMDIGFGAYWINAAARVPEAIILPDTANHTDYTASELHSPALKTLQKQVGS